MTDRRGGRIRPDGRPPQAAGVGANAKRHDLERPATPGLHGSDLQQGEVSQLERGQRVQPIQENPVGQAPPQPAGRGQSRGGGGGVQVPDAIDFLAKKNGQEFGPPVPQRRLDSSKALTWLPILRELAAGPGASSALVNAFINQARRMQQAAAQPATFVDLRATDDGIEAMLDEGI